MKNSKSHNVEKRGIDMTAEFSEFAVINEQFTRCRCRVCYAGRNRNYSDITENAIQNLIDRKGYANVPVVAHLIKDKDGNYKVGGHDYKIVLESNGNSGNIEYIDETAPVGVIPEDCNPRFEDVTETSGKVNRYFTVDIILWSHRYPIMEAAYNDKVYFNQSMEIIFNDCHEDGQYIVVDDFSLSALCLLNKSDGDDNVEPCFQSADVEKYDFAADKGFKRKFNELLKKYKSYNQMKGDENGSMKEKVLNVLEQCTYTNALGKSSPKYALIEVTDDTVSLFDRTDGRVYTANYSVAEDETVTVDFSKLTECAITLTEKTETSFDLSAEFAAACAFAATAKESEFETSVAQRIEDFNKQKNELCAQNEQLKADYAKTAAELKKYVEADKERAREKHVQEINSIYDELEPRFQPTAEGLSAFWAYKADARNYAKSVEDVKNELTFKLGEIAAKSKISGFGYVPVEAPIHSFSLQDENPAAKERYGDLLERVMNKQKN